MQILSPPKIRLNAQRFPLKFAFHFLLKAVQSKVTSETSLQVDFLLCFKASYFPNESALVLFSYIFISDEIITGTVR